VLMFGMLSMVLVGCGVVDVDVLLCALRVLVFCLVWCARLLRMTSSFFLLNCWFLYVLMGIDAVGGLWIIVTVVGGFR